MSSFIYSADKSIYGAFYRFFLTTP